MSKNQSSDAQDWLRIGLKLKNTAELDAIFNDSASDPAETAISNISKKVAEADQRLQKHETSTSPKIPQVYPASVYAKDEFSIVHVPSDEMLLKSQSSFEAADEVPVVFQPRKALPRTPPPKIEDHIDIDSPILSVASQSPRRLKSISSPISQVSGQSVSPKTTKTSSRAVSPMSKNNQPSSNENVYELLLKEKDYSESLEKQLKQSMSQQDQLWIENQKLFEINNTLKETVQICQEEITELNNVSKENDTLKRELNDIYMDLKTEQRNSLIIKEDLTHYQSLFDIEKGKNDNLEAEMDLFHTKFKNMSNQISSLRSENEKLYEQLRKFQYDSGSAASDSSQYYKDKYEQAMYDVQALKALVQDMGTKVSEPDLTLVELPKKSPPKSTSGSFTQYLESNRPKTTPNRIQFASPITPDRSVPIPRKSLTMQDLRKLDFFEAKRLLEDQMNELVRRQNELLSEYQRLPAKGGFAQLKREQLEQELDQVQVEISAVKKRMRESGLL